MINIKGLKIIRILLVTASCAVAAIPVSTGAEYFRGLFILSAGYCYDYYNLAQSAGSNNRYMKCLGIGALIWSVLIFMISLSGLLGVLITDSNPLTYIKGNNWLIPSYEIPVWLLTKALLAFPVIAGMELFSGRVDSIDREPEQKKKKVDDDNV